MTGLQSDNYVHWYQQKDGEALKRILYVNKDGRRIDHNTDVPDSKDFTVQLENGNNYVLPYWKHNVGVSDKVASVWKHKVSNKVGGGYNFYISAALPTLRANPSNYLFYYLLQILRWYYVLKWL